MRTSSGSKHRVIRWQNYPMGHKVAVTYLTYLGLYAVPPAVTLTQPPSVPACRQLLLLIPSFQTMIRVFMQMAMEWCLFAQ